MLLQPRPPKLQRPGLLSLSLLVPVPVPVLLRRLLKLQRPGLLSLVLLVLLRRRLRRPRQAPCPENA